MASFELDPKATRIADYVWYRKARKYWYLWIGNPFCVSLYKVPLAEMSEDEIKAVGKRIGMKEKERFKRDFPDVEWKEWKGGSGGD